MAVTLNFKVTIYFPRLAPQGTALTLEITNANLYAVRLQDVGIQLEDQQFSLMDGPDAPENSIWLLDTPTTDLLPAESTNLSVTFSALELLLDAYSIAVPLVFRIWVDYQNGSKQVTRFWSDPWKLEHRPDLKLDERTTLMLQRLPA